MQTEAHKDEAKIKLFHPRSMYGSNVRSEKNRVILADRNELPKSIYNLGQLRHNVSSKNDL